MSQITEFYRNYIECLNSRSLRDLPMFVDAEVVRNGVKLGLSGYTKLMQQNYSAIPDLRFTIDLLIVEDQYIASRLSFDCTPKGTFMGIPVNGQRVQFTENVFYRIKNGKIQEVWSVVDKAAIEEQVC